MESQIRRDRIAQRHAEQRKKQVRSLLFIVLGALLVVFLIALPSILPPSFKSPAAIEHPQADGTRMGNPDAPLVMEVYSDFRCGYCARHAVDVEPLIIENYVATGKLYYVYYTFSQPKNSPYFYPPSYNSAQGAYCAAEQNKFWQYHDMLYANYEIEPVGKNLSNMAKAAGLDVAAFDECLGSGKFEQQVNADFENGVLAGVQGTPYFYLNGELVMAGAAEFAAFQQVIEGALASLDQ